LQHLWCVQGGMKSFACLLLALPLAACAAAEASEPGPAADRQAVAAFLARQGEPVDPKTARLDSTADAIARAPLERSEGMLSRLAR
jgi:hypothetical protein